MPIVRMPDGQLVNMPDRLTPEQKTLLMAKEAMKKNGGMTSRLAAASGIRGQPEPEEREQYYAPGLGAAPTAIRMAGGMGGGALGMAGGPAGMIAGGIAGSAAADPFAQALEKRLGQREEYNPLRTAGEAVVGGISGLVPGAGSVVKAGLAAGGVGAISETIMSLAEKGELPPVGQTALSALVSMGMGGAIRYGVGRHALRELLGDDEIAKAAEFIDSGMHVPGVDPDRVRELKELFTVPPPVSQSVGFRRTPTPRGEFLQSFRKEAPVTGRETIPTRAYISKETGEEILGAGRPSRLPYSAGWEEEVERRAETMFGPAPEKPGYTAAYPMQKNLPYKKEDIQGLLTEFMPEAYRRPSQDIEKDLVGYVKGARGTLLPGSMSLPRRYFSALEDKYGIPIFRDYKQVSDAYRKVESTAHKMAPGLVSSFKDTSASDRQMILSWLSYPDKKEASKAVGDRLARKAEMTRREIDRATQVFGFSADETFQELIPSIFAGQKLTDVPKKFQNLIKYALDDDLSLTEPDLAKFTTRLLRAASFEKEIGPLWRTMQQKYSDRALPEDVRTGMNTYLNAVRGSPDITGNRVALSIANYFRRGTKDMTDAEKRKAIGVARDWAGDMTAALYMNTMGFRPGPVIRNSLQSVQTGSAMLGGKYLAAGMRDYYTKAGKKMLSESGVLGEQAALGELMELARNPNPDRFEKGEPCQHGDVW
jgi:uncharacterized protein YbaA (DUF1428 family)